MAIKISGTSVIDDNRQIGNIGIATATTFSGNVTGTAVTSVTFTSTQTTGTAPFTVSSTTLVSNLNADQLDGVEGSSYLRSDATDTASGAITFTAIPAFNGGTSGVDAPFTVDSTFLVSNLNADLLDGQEGSYYTDLGNASAGTLAIARGGTNSTSTPTNGGAAYGTGSAFAFTSAGTSGQVLTSNGAAAPTWEDAAGGSFAPVNFVLSI